MNRETINNSLKEISIPLVAALCLCVGTLLGISLRTHQFATGEVQIASKKYRNILNSINKEYADTVDIQHLFEVGMKEMLYKLDPHSSYVPATDFLTKTSLDSDFHGVGVRYVYLRDTLFVAEAIANGPAAKAGVQAGDRIIEVNDSSIVAVKSANTIYNLLRGKNGSVVNVKVYRRLEQSILDLKITRGTIPNSAVDLAYMLDDENGYIKLNRFSNRSSEEMRDKIIMLKEKGLKNLILDLRDNGGGLYYEAVAICDEFLDQGRDIVFTQSRGIIKDKQKSEVIGEFEEGGLVVLINKNSASASEIVSGALQDNDRAIILGGRSYGKGLVQTPFKLFDDSELRLTTSRYYTPSGRCIQKPYNAQQYEHTGVRLQTGELYDEGKVYKNDSLKYHTVNMRTVYGGGGIYPDVFIPQDSSLQTELIAKLYADQCFMEFGILYSLEHQEKIGDLETFIKSFEIDQQGFDAFYLFCKSLGMKISKKDLLDNREVIVRELKIQIADARWGELGRRKVLNLFDKHVQESVKIFPNASQILNPSR